MTRAKRSTSRSHELPMEPCASWGSSMCADAPGGRLDPQRAGTYRQRSSELGSRMRRRDVLSLFGGAAVSWSGAGRAQQAAMPLLGFLGFSSPQAFAAELAGFQRGLREIGFVEGQNVAIEYRWAHGQFDRFQACE